MRYYRIDVADKTLFTSHLNGPLQPPDPGALLVEIDVVTAGMATPWYGSGTGIRIWGIPVSFISQAKVFNGKSIKLYGGMGKGLPLANPAQSGLLMMGSVQQAFANWIGTVMTLEFILMAPILSPTGDIDKQGVDAGSGNAAKIIVDWKKNTKLASALQSALQTAFKGYTIDIKISDKLVQDHDEPGKFSNLQDLAGWANSVSRTIIGANKNLGSWASQSAIDSTQIYRGVDIWQDGKTINVRDGTASTQTSVNATTGDTKTAAGSASNPIAIQFNDLIGQPTWVGPNEIQVTCVMRADVKPFSFITLPRTRATVTPPSVAGTGTFGSPYIDNVTFQGTYFVPQVHHIGNYKDPSAMSWVTIMNCYVNPPDAAVPEGTVSIDILNLTDTSGKAVP